MAPPSQLYIATSSLLRLVKEESSYHQELQQQESRLKKLQGEAGDENHEYIVKQETRAIEETKAVFPSLRERIKEATERLEEQLTSEGEARSESNVEEVTKGKEAIAKAKTAYREIA